MAVYDSLNLIAECNAALNEEVGGAVVLNPYPITYSVDFNQRESTISVNIGFGNLKYPYVNDFRDFNYTIDVTPIINLELPIQTLNNGTKIFDINSKLRGTISIQGTAVSVDGTDQTANLKNIAKTIVASYFNNFFLESNVVEKTYVGGEKGDGYTFNCSASFSFEDYPSNLFELP